MKGSVTCLLVVLVACATEPASSASSPGKVAGEKGPELGNFSVSLAVKDLALSRGFYENLGFSVMGGAPEHNYLILQNGRATIGLFQGMFEENILTFNPGWTHKAEPLEHFTDVRDIQRMLVSRGIKPVSPADDTTTGPASFVVVDPDGNPVLIDQHVPRPTAGG